MNRTSDIVNGMFAIVRLGLWGEETTSDGTEPGRTPADGTGPQAGSNDGPSFSEAEWKQAVAEAKRQGVLGIFCEGVRLLRPECMPPSQLRISMLLDCDALEHRSEHVETTSRNLLERFREAGLSPIVQKGPSVAVFYPKPLMRKSGDIDLYFKTEDFTKAKEMAEIIATASRIESEPDGSICYNYDNVTVEHHSHFFDSKAQFEGVDPDTPEAIILLQITHILKHALGPGIGLKQICDYAVVTRCILPECDIRILGECIRRAHLQRWLGRLDAFITTYLGVPQEELLSSQTGISLLSPAPLLDIVLQGGEFGHHNPFRTLMASPRRRKLNTLRFFLQRLPFALSTAPAEWWHTFSALVKGNLTH